MPTLNQATPTDHWSEITRRISAGDSSVFPSFYESFFDIMFTEARRLSGKDEASCLDFVQDSMLKAIKAMRPIENHSQLIAFTKTIVRSVVYDAFRRNAAIARREQEYQSGKSSESTDDWIDEKARMVWIEQQVDKMDDDLRSLFHFRYRLGWSLKKIGAHVGLKTGAVDGRIRRALEQIKIQAREQFGES